jgi:dinuclear metal center YbgI/SA1388 family protein
VSAKFGVGNLGVVPSLTTVLAALEGWYPPATAAAWDAVGLTCGDPAADIGKVLLAIDCVPVTVDEAISTGAQLLLTHHPLLMGAVHGIPVSDPKGGLVHRMVLAGVAHYVAHTNADIAVNGVSHALADVLGLMDAHPLEAGQALVGTGRIGQLAQPVPLRTFVDDVLAGLPATVWGVRAAGHPDKLISRVAVCGGSGGGYATLARSLGADVLVTADLKHHTALEAVAERTFTEDPADAPMALIDAAHWATEAPWLDRVAGLLRAEFGADLSVAVSRLVTDPWTMHVR